MVVSTRSVWHLASVEEGVGATAGDNEGLGASGAGVLKGSRGVTHGNCWESKGGVDLLQKRFTNCRFELSG